MGNKIDVIIPAYKAQNTILRTVSSIAEQTILDDIEVTIVNDCCPNGDYHKIVDMFKPCMKIREIKTEKNGGAGVARQYGIDNTKNPYFTCIDADDTFNGTMALEVLRIAIEEDEANKCVSSTMMEMSDTHMVLHPHQNDMIWMFGKLYRRDFIEKYNIRFNGSRANEDTCFNTFVKLICDNENERVRYITDPIYYWHNNSTSITRINNRQYSYDQNICGYIDNMIYVADSISKLKEMNENIIKHITAVLMRIFYMYVQTVANRDVFAEQTWEYAKKYYNRTYKNVEKKVTDELFGQMYSEISADEYSYGSMNGIIPCMGIKEFMDKLRSEEYDPDHIYDVWEKLPKELIENNEKCGVCPVGYTKRPVQENVKGEAKKK